MPLPVEPFQRSSFSYLASLESHHWWFRARNQIILWAIRTKTSNISSFLEVGCGTGYVISGISKAFPAIFLEATDYFEEGLVFARERVPQCAFRRLDATSMTEKDVCDCIGSFDVIEHISQDEIVLCNFYQALRPGGYLLLTVPQHQWLWSAADESARHLRRYTAKELRSKVLRAQFRIVYCSSFVCLLLPLMAWQRLSNQDQSRNPDAEFRISPLLNASLYLVMQLELALLRLGLRFPAGGSLLLLARKP